MEGQMTFSYLSDDIEQQQPQLREHNSCLILSYNFPQVMMKL